MFASLLQSQNLLGKGHQNGEVSVHACSSDFTKVKKSVVPLVFVTLTLAPEPKMTGPTEIGPFCAARPIQCSETLNKLSDKGSHDGGHG